MKRLLYILLSLNLFMLWMGNMVDMPREYPAAAPSDSPAAQIATPQQHVLDAIKESMSLFELPVQLRINPTEHISSVLRVIPSLQSVAQANRPVASNNSFYYGIDSPHLFPNVERSADHYIYAFRKIVI